MMKIFFQAFAAFSLLVTFSNAAWSADDTAEGAVETFLEYYYKGDADSMIGKFSDQFPDMPTTSSYQLKITVQQSLDLYGMPTDHAVIENQEISPKLQMMEIVVHQEKMPTFWSFLVYNNGECWQVINFFFKDAMLWANERQGQKQ